MRQKLVSASGNILYIVIPAFNEMDNILRVVEGWYPVVEKHNGNGKSRLVVVDDGSTDETYDMLTEFACARPLMEVLTKPNTGHGPTVLYGYRYALDHGADFIFQTDSDGQTLPSEFEQFWRCRANADLVIGHRGHRQDGKGRIFVTHTLRRVILAEFHVYCRDANCPYRLMRASALREIIDRVPEDAFLANTLLTVLFTRGNYRITYISISFRQRQGGENSINRKKIFEVGRQAIRDFRSLNAEWNAGDTAGHSHGSDAVKR